MWTKNILRRFILCCTTLTNITVGSLPAGNAHLVTLVAARVVSELVVARPTEGGARGVVVVCRTLDAYPAQQ